MFPLRLIGFIGCLVLASACAAPISVTRLDSQTAQRELTRKVLTVGEPSEFSQIILKQADLYGKFNEDPEWTLRALHGELAVEGGMSNKLFALAELSFLYADRSHKGSYYLAAAVYA
jgi:hypothetical protein